MPGTIADVVRIARGWVGRDFRAGTQAQCAEFVREVFWEAHVVVGVAKRPSDTHLLPPGAPQGPSYANSFSGDDVGRQVARGALQPGDIVLLRNTYGDWRPGVITHVGIYVGNGLIVHRPTSARPVELTELAIYGDLFVEGRRVSAPIPAPVSPAAPPAPTKPRVKVAIHPGGARVYIPPGLASGWHDLVAADAWFEAEM